MDCWPLIELNLGTNPIETVTEEALLQIDRVCRFLTHATLHANGCNWIQACTNQDQIETNRIRLWESFLDIAGGEKGSNLIKAPPRFNPSQETTSLNYFTFCVRLCEPLR